MRYSTDWKFTFVPFSLLLLSPFASPAFFPFDVILLLASGSALLFTGLVLLQRPHIQLPKTFLIVCVIIMTGQISGYLIAVPAASEAWALHALLYLSAMLLFITGINTPCSKLLTLMHIYLLTSLFWSIGGLFVWLGGNDGNAIALGVVTLIPAPSIKLSGPFLQGNIFASLIGFSIIFSHWLFLKTGKSIYALAILFFAICFIDSLSRGAWISYTIVLFILLLSMRTVITQQMMKNIALLWTAALVVGYMLVELSQPAGMEIVVGNADVSLFQRVYIWLTAFNEFTRSLFLGVGWGQFPTEFWRSGEVSSILLKDYESLQPHNIAFSAHNIFLHAAAEGGLIALIALLWATSFLLGKANTFIHNKNSPRLPFALTCLGFLAHAQISTVFSSPLPLLLVAMFAGISMAPFLRTGTARYTLSRQFKRASAIAIMLTISWVLYSSWQWFNAEAIVQRLDINNAESIRTIATGIADRPRIAAIPLSSLGQTIAMTKQHSNLLVWMIPFLENSIDEVPTVTAHQVLFYAHNYSGNYQRACELGQKIMAMNLIGEINRDSYFKVCEGKKSERYNFGL